MESFVLPMMTSHVLFEQMVALPGQQLPVEAFPRHETTESANKKDRTRTHLPCTKCNGGHCGDSLGHLNLTPQKMAEDKFKFMEAFGPSV